jgi:hypothetical protein
VTHTIEVALDAPQTLALVVEQRRQARVEPARGQAHVSEHAEHENERDDIECGDPHLGMSPEAICGGHAANQPFPRSEETSVANAGASR